MAVRAINVMPINRRKSSASIATLGLGSMSFAGGTATPILSAERKYDLSASCWVMATLESFTQPPSIRCLACSHWSRGPRPPGSARLA
jgi:hypothetical protein